MDREIKFRAWDTFKNTMHYGVENGIYEDPDEIIPFDSVLGFACYEVMQYTRLKDKNGKEIYEGDIIQFEWIDDSCWGEAGTYKGYIKFSEGVFEVVYIDRERITTNDDGSWHENSKSDDIKSLFSWSEEIEVVGNVYENKDKFSEVTDHGKV